MQKKTDIEIEATAEEVWRYLTVPELMAGWMTGMDAIRTGDGGPVVRDGNLHFEARGRQRTSRVTAFEPAQCLELTSIQGPIRAIYRYNLTATSGGTRLSLRIECDASGPTRLLMPLIGLLIWGADRGQPGRLRSVLLHDRVPAA